MFINFIVGLTKVHLDCYKSGNTYIGNTIIVIIAVHIKCVEVAFTYVSEH